MKPFPVFFRAALLSGLLAFAAASARAQVYRPDWGPAVPTSAQYYYLPEVGGYYDLRAQQYVVRQGGRWQRLAQLNGYNPTSWHPVVVDYVGAEPWSRYDEYRRRYPANLPPGQQKRLERGKGLPPGQAKKYGSGRAYGDDHQDGRRDDDDRGDDRGKKGKGHGKH